VFPKSERFYNLLFLKKFKFFHLPLDRSNIGCPSFHLTKVGQILRFIRQKQVDGEIKSREETLELLRDKFGT